MNGYRCVFTVKSWRLCCASAVTNMSGPGLQSAIAQLATCGLISGRGDPSDAIYIFKHALVQDAAYATMLRSKRQQLHGQIANAVMRGSPRLSKGAPS